MALPVNETLTRTFIRELEIESVGKTLSIHQNELGDVGCVVWDAAIVLAKYIEKESERKNNFEKTNWLKGAQVVELGSGTGCVGLVAACFGADVLLTDLPMFVPLLKLNIEVNQKVLSGTAAAESLKWGEVISGISKPDMLLVADCVYYDQSLQPLVSTMVDLCHPHTEVLLSYEERMSESKKNLQACFLELASSHFHIEKVPLCDHHSEYRSEDIHILRLKRT